MDIIILVCYQTCSRTSHIVIPLINWYFYIEINAGMKPQYVIVLLLCCETPISWKYITGN